CDLANPSGPRFPRFAQPAGRLTGSPAQCCRGGCHSPRGSSDFPLDPGICGWKGTPGLTTDARAELEAFLLGDRFACLAGRSAWRQGGITHRHYEVMGGEESARLMALDLAEFVGAANWNRSEEHTSELQS